jgi:hypothetical protein
VVHAATATNANPQLDGTGVTTVTGTGTYADKCNVTYTSKKDLGVTCGVVVQNIIGGAECGGGKF